MTQIGTKKEAMNTDRPSLRARAGTAAFALIVAAGCASSVITEPAQAQSLSGSKPIVVGMKALKFNPKVVKAKVNQQVDFKWDESVAHNVVFDKSRKSKTLAKKGTIWSTKFDKPGTFKYKCTLHPGMQGQVDVSK
jgi:plastocyanin